jgi:hypothetical protein
MGSKGSKPQRQNQHVKRLESKIRRFKKNNKDTSGLEKELGYMMGETRPEFKSGRDVDPRLKKKKFN